MAEFDVKLPESKRTVLFPPVSDSYALAAKEIPREKKGSKAEKEIVLEINNASKFNHENIQ